MRLVLVGADFEENLGMCMIAAAAESAGYATAVVPFQGVEDRSDVVARVLAARPDVVGLAAQFQHRGMDFLALACDLRRASFRGHVTAGGQFATMAHHSILTGRYGVDSVVLYEGEQTTAELLGALARGESLQGVAGLALPDGQRGTYRTAPRPLVAALDRLPLAQRYRQHSRQMGVPFIPISGSRGCWAGCSFCSITTVLRDGREHGVTGNRLRLRPPEDVGLEMAMLAHAVGDSAIFCFHDENFLLPRPADSVARIAAMRKVLDEQGVARLGFVGKCRPDTVTKDLARELARLGVMRMYVGVENASPNGALHLNRGTDVASMGSALQAFADAGIFVCYNLLIFEPEATLNDIGQNLAFMREHAAHPVNFCRAEPYLGTPMHRRLQAAGKLRGGFLGWDYRIEDDRTELMFRITASAFRERNFASNGVANRYMGLGYTAKILDLFYKDDRGQCANLMERAQEITRSITLDSADLLERAMDMAAQADLSDHDQVARKTARLGLRVAASDRVWHAAMDALEKDMARFVRGEMQVERRSTRRTAGAVQGAAMAGWLGLWASGATGCTGSTSIDPVPAPADAHRDLTVNDPLPPPADAHPDVTSASDSASPDARPDITVYDPPPPPADARPDIMVYDPPPPPSDARPDSDLLDGQRDGLGEVGDRPDGPLDLAFERPLVVDCVPPPADARDVQRDQPLIVDPLPPPTDARDAAKNDLPGMVVDPLPAPSASLLAPAAPVSGVAEHWTDTAPARMKRSQDLALCLCPEIRLGGQWRDGKVHVNLAGVPDAFTVRWQAQGLVDGAGAEVVWTPSSDEDQLDVAVRTKDGVAVSELRLGQVAGSKEA